MMDKKILFLLFILLLTPVYSDSYEEYTNNGILSCFPYSSSFISTSSCFLSLYKTNNSHVALCNITTPLKYGCNITVSTTIGNQIKDYRIPINFTWISCQNGFLYLYDEKNSHVSIYNASNLKYSICLDQYFQRALNVYNTSQGIFLIGLYKYNNSHVTINESESVGVRLYIDITDRDFPNVSYNDTRDYTDYSRFPIYINVTFYDNTSYLYYCNIYVNGRSVDISDSCRYNSSYSYVFNITSSDCTHGTNCTITYVAVDLAGNLYKRVKNYTVLNPCLSIIP